MAVANLATVLLVLACLHPIGAANVVMHLMPGATSHLLGALEISKALQSRGHQVAVLIEAWDLAAVSHKLDIADLGLQHFIINRARGNLQEEQAKWAAALRAMHTQNPIKASKVYLQHAASSCRSFLGNAAVMEEVHAFAPSLVLADHSYLCGNLLSEVLPAPLVAISFPSLLEPIDGDRFGYPTPASTVPAVGSALTPHMVGAVPACPPWKQQQARMPPWLTPSITPLSPAVFQATPDQFWHPPGDAVGDQPHGGRRGHSAAH